jgi:Conserved TM helix
MPHTQQIYVASVDWTGGINQMWNSFTTWVPRFVGFLLVLVIGWMIAKVIGKAVEAVLRRLHFDNVIERAGMSRALENSQYDGSKIVGMIAYYLMLLIVLQVAFGVFGSNPINTVLRSILAWIPRGLVAVAIIVIAAMIARAARDLVTNMLSSLSYGRTMGNAVGVCIIALGVFAALGQAGIATAVSQPLLTAILATVAGVLIVGVGGGMIRPMQARWERMLDSAEREASRAAVTTRASMSGGEAYAAGHMHGTQAAEEEARRAREGMTDEGGMSGPEATQS